MKRRVMIFLVAALAIVGLALAQVPGQGLFYLGGEDPWWRPLNPQGQSYGITVGSTRPSPAMNGEIFLDMDGAADSGPLLEVYDGTNAEWDQIGGVNNLLSGLTANTIIKVNSAGTDLADSQLTDDGTDVTLASTAQFLVGDGSATASNIRFGADNDAFIFWSDASPLWIFDGDATAATWTSFRVPNDGFFEVTNSATSGYMLFDPLNAANAGFTQLELYSELVNIDNDTISIIKVDASWADNPTGGNLRGLDFATPAPDANTTETAIYIVSGWDYGLSIIGDGSATTNNITLGASQTADAQIYFDGADLAIDVDGTAANGILASIGNDTAGGAAFTVQNAGLANQFIFLGSNTSNAGFNVFEIEVASIIATDGSDIVNVFDLDWNETDWATSTETLNGININSITQDTQGTYNAINIDGQGWDSAINLEPPADGGNADLGTYLQGLVRMEMLALGVLDDGTSGATEIIIDDDPTGEWTEVDAGTEVTTDFAETAVVRKGTNSIQITWTDSAIDGDGMINALGGDEDWEGLESVGFWHRCTTTTVAGDLELNLTEVTGDVQFAIPAIATADTWEWAEIDITSLAGGTGDAVVDLEIELSGQGVAAAQAFDCFFDYGFIWDAADETALSRDIIVDGVVSMVTVVDAQGTANAMTNRTEGTDWIINYQSGDDVLVSVSNLSTFTAMVLVFLAEDPNP